jgi:hemerythrin-like metal-binding protein
MSVIRDRGKAAPPDPSAALARLQEQHAAMDRIVTAAALLIGTDAVRERTRICQSLDALEDLATVHFGCEETLMLARHFPGYPNHKRNHDALLRTLRDYIAALRIDATPLSAEDGRSLRRWVAQHTAKYDAAFYKTLD